MKACQRFLRQITKIQLSMRNKKRKKTLAELKVIQDRETKMHEGRNNFFAAFCVWLRSGEKQQQHLCEQGCLWEQRVPAPNRDLSRVRADTIELVILLTLSVTLKERLKTAIFLHHPRKCTELGFVEMWQLHHNFLQKEPQSCHYPSRPHA